MNQKATTAAPSSADCYLVHNINDYVRVKLNDHGRQLHRKRHDEFWGQPHRTQTPEYKAPTEDEDGWSKWQLWALLAEFGGDIGLGLKVPFDTNIEFCVSK